MLAWRFAFIVWFFSEVRMWSGKFVLSFVRFSRGWKMGWWIIRLSCGIVLFFSFFSILGGFCNITCIIRRCMLLHNLNMIGSMLRHRFLRDIVVWFQQINFVLQGFIVFFVVFGLRYQAILKFPSRSLLNTVCKKYKFDSKESYLIRLKFVFY